ncbi:hypothetical protein B0T13DRAFT_447116 [Neurospora crassa]|nr:hypothetical protein B0T13DRAFT_447116 [Neurospora crassa]
MTFNLVAVVYPKEGKLERVKELGKEISAWVEANEPNTLQYHWSTSKEDDKPVIVIQEIYADEAAFHAHKESPKFGWLIETATKEDLFAAPIKILFLEPFTGFAGQSRKGCYIEKDEQRGTNGGSRLKSLSVTSTHGSHKSISGQDHDAFKDTAGSTTLSPDACSRGSFSSLLRQPGRELGEECGASGSGSGESRVLAITVPFRELDEQNNTSREETGEWNPKKPNSGVHSTRKIPLGTLGFSRPSTGSRNGGMQSRVAPNEVIGRVIVQFNSPLLVVKGDNEGPAYIIYAKAVVNLESIITMSIADIERCSGVMSTILNPGFRSFPFHVLQQSKPRHIRRSL